MNFTFRIILDAEQDIFRDIRIASESNFEELHFAIVNAFGLEPGQRASFYESDEEWNQGHEISLENFSDGPAGPLMSELRLNEFFVNTHERMLYAYDFMDMWTFFVELLQIDEESALKVPEVVMSIGNTPDSAPGKAWGEGSGPDEDDDDIFKDDDTFDEFGMDIDESWN